MRVFLIIALGRVLHPLVTRPLNALLYWWECLHEDAVKEWEDWPPKCKECGCRQMMCLGRDGKPRPSGMCSWCEGEGKRGKRVEEVV